MLLYYPGSTGTIVDVIFSSVFIFTFLDSDVLGVCVCPTQVMHTQKILLGTSVYTPSTFSSSFLHQLDVHVL